MLVLWNGSDILLLDMIGGKAPVFDILRRGHDARVWV